MAESAALARWAGSTPRQIEQRGAFCDAVVRAVDRYKRYTSEDYW